MSGNPLKNLIAKRGKSILTAAAKDVVRAAAPNLGKAIGGPLGRIAENEIARAVTGSADADPAELSKRIEAGDAETMAALVEAQAKLEAAGVDLARVEAEDRADARDHRSTVTDIIAGGVLIWTAAYKAALLFVTPAADMMVSVQNTDQLLEYLCIAVVGFYFGSSWGSKRKDALMVGAGR